MSKSAVLGAKARIEKVETGLENRNRRQSVEDLGGVLADTYALYLKTRGFHWNVVGPLFFGLHKLTEAQYQELATAIDKIAERIRALGFPAPASFKRFVELRSIEEEVGTSSTEGMIYQLFADHEAVARSLRDVAADADEAQDDVTVELVTQRPNQHEQVVWMLRALISWRCVGTINMEVQRCVIPLSALSRSS